MTRVLLVIAFLSVLAATCAALEADEPRAGVLPTATFTVTPQPTATSTITPQPTATSTVTPRPTSTPTLVSEVLPALEQAPPVEAPPLELAPIRGGTVLPMPEGVTVVWGGCASDGECHWYNFYWAPTREAVMQAGEGAHKVQHELCHAHQHWSINGGAPLDPSDYDLESWYTTAEGRSFQAAVSGISWPWTHSAVSGLEDFAWTCAYWYLDPAYLQHLSPERYGWAAANLP